MIWEVLNQKLLQRINQVNEWMDGLTIGTVLMGATLFQLLYGVEAEMNGPKKGTCCARYGVEKSNTSLKS